MRLSEAKTPDDVLETLARRNYYQDHDGADCPSEKIPSVAALTEWLPDSPPEAWVELWERSRTNTLGSGKGGAAIQPPPIGTVGRPRLTTVPLQAQASGIASTDTGAAFSLLRTGMMAAHAWRWDNERRDLFPAHLFRWHPLGPAIEALHDHWQRRTPRPKHPLEPLVKAWQERPLPLEPETRPDRIFPALLNTFRKESEAPQGRLFNLDIVPRRGEQVKLPFSADGDGQSLLVELFERTGGNAVSRGRGGPASVALRIWTEGVLSVPVFGRDGHPREFEYKGIDPATGRGEIGMRPLARKLWPGVRLRRRNYEQLVEAAEALDRLWIGVRTPDNSNPLYIRLVTLTRAQLPEPGRWGHPGRAKFVVDLPKGAERGPIISPKLHVWGRSAPAFRFLLSAPFHWWKPGRTRAPKHGCWMQLRNPKRYPKLTDDLKIQLAYPVSADRLRRRLLHRADKVIEKLEAAGEIQIVEGCLLPPKSWFGEEDS